LGSAEYPASAGSAGSAEFAGSGFSVGSAVVVPVLRRDRSEPVTALAAVARLHVSGASVDWPAMLGLGGRRVDLPTYPFQRHRCWLDTAQPVGDLRTAGLDPADHPLLGAAVMLAGTDGLVLTGQLSVAGHPWLADHAVAGSILFPGTGFVELAVRAAD